MRVPSVDIYCTYRCNMRCRHCFLGSLLGSNTDLPQDALLEFLAKARGDWETEEVTFLGGEPTLYPSIREALEVSLERGFRTRLVSNGSAACGAIIRQFRGRGLHFAFSLDGARPEHDSVRRRGSFERVLEAAELAKSLGHTTSGIVSVGSYNVHTIASAIRELDNVGVDYVNVHYVTARGFACEDDSVQAADWLREWGRIRGGLPGVACSVRFEKTFRLPDEPHQCAIADRSMLMLFPDQRVFSCTMLVDAPNGHQYEWVGGKLEANEDFILSGTPGVDARGHCPAAGIVDPGVTASAERAGCRVACIFDKTEVGGKSRSRIEGSVVSY